MGNAILRGQTGGASPTVISQKKLTLLADVTIYSARTSVDFTGLNVGADTELLLVSDINNTTATNCAYLIFVNGNLTETNYWYQEQYSYSSSIASARANTPQLSYAFANTKTYSNANLKMTNNGFFVSQSNNNIGYSNGSQIYQGLRYATSTFTISSITSLTVYAGATNAIGIGSRFQLYSLNTGGEKTWVTS